MTDKKKPAPKKEPENQLPLLEHIEQTLRQKVAAISAEIKEYEMALEKLDIIQEKNGKATPEEAKARIKFRLRIAEREGGIQTLREIYDLYFRTWQIAR